MAKVQSGDVIIAWSGQGNHGSVSCLVEVINGERSFLAVFGWTYNILLNSTALGTSHPSPEVVSWYE